MHRSWFTSGYPPACVATLAGKARLKQHTVSGAEGRQRLDLTVLASPLSFTTVKATLSALSVQKEDEHSCPRAARASKSTAAALLLSFPMSWAPSSLSVQHLEEQEEEGEERTEPGQRPT